MNKQIIDEKLKTVKFKGANWDVTVEPNYGGNPKNEVPGSAHQKKLCFPKTEGGNSCICIW